jgi:hypothetical protein
MRALLVLLAIAVATAQTPHNPLRHWMERAQPRPELSASEPPAIPLLQPLSPRHPLFPNSNLIEPETDPLPIQNESSIAVNPTNPANLIASAVDYRANSSTWVYVSTDGGRSWRNINLGKPFPDWVSSNDPSVTFDGRGRAYLCYGGFNLETGENGVFVAISSDGGRTWQPHIPVILHRGTMTADSAFEDKYYITADNCPRSPYFGRLYIPWKRVIARDSSTQIVLSYSTDGGLTWSAPVPVSERLPYSSEDTTYGQSFPLAATGPDGTVYVVWNHGPQKAIGFARSTDGGRSFEAPRLIQRYRPLGTAKRIPEGVRHTLKGGVRAETYPVLVCDTTSGPRQGWLYLCWAADSVPNVYFSRSTDGGLTWSTPIIVHSDTAGDQFWPWMALDPTTGDLAIMYLDSRDDPANLLVTTSVSYSSNGGSTWVDRRVGDTTWDIRQNPFRENAFAGDYSGCAFFDGWVYPSWVDMRNVWLNARDNDVYTARVNVRAPLPVENFRVRVLPELPTALDLSWEAPSARVFGQPLQEFAYLLLRNGQLHRVLPQQQTAYRDTGLAPHELYRYGIAVVSGRDTSLFRWDSARAGGARQPAPPSLFANSPLQPDSVVLSVELPRYRADGVTPLTNLSELRLYRDGSLVLTLPLLPSDTGRRILLSDRPSERGFYRYSATVRAGAEESSPSNLLILYAGAPLREGLFEPFASAELARYYNSGRWGLTSTFAYSPPYALTESPDGPYPNRARDTLMLFPIALPEVTIPEARRAVRVEFVHAAIIDRTDTGFVEYAWNTWDRWERLAAYNLSAYAPWGDTVLSAEDWRRESFLLLAPDTAQLLWVRFRFASNPIRVNDGWYIDDIALTPTTDIERSSPQVQLFPNPAQHYLVYRAPDAAMLEYRWRDLLGRTLPAHLLQRSSQEAVLDLRSMAPGTYLLLLRAPDGTVRTYSVTLLR